MFLLSNDDGIDAPGLRALADGLTGTSDIVVVAPSAEQSARSHALTMHRPLRVDHRPGRWHGVSGTPADCVYLAVHHLCGERPAAVLSGINRGSNLGNDVHYSGTVAAAREAALMGIPSMAISLHVARGGGPRHPVEHHWNTAVAIALPVLQRLLDDPLPRGVFLNLNVPDVPAEAIKGLAVAPMGRREYEAAVRVDTDPRGLDYYWIGGAGVSNSGDERTDGWFIEHGFATLTPLMTDITAHDLLDRVRDWGIEAAQDRSTE